MPGVIKVLPQHNRKPALGRGLGALLADARAPSEKGQGGGPTKLPIEQIHADRANPRRNFDEAALEELATSLKHQGVLQPILVRKDGRGYRIIAGERRWRAAQKAGLTELPVVVREASDAEAYELALVENIQRADLNPLEEAEAYRRLVDERKLTQEQVADRVGKDRSSVANSLRLLHLPNEVKQLVAEGDLDMGHARAILGLASSKEMVLLARDVVTDKLTVRETEARVKVAKGGGPVSVKKKGAAKHGSPEAKKLVEDLQRRLGTKVRLVERGGGKGTLEVEFFSYEDLDRIVALIRR
ncbi:MAG: ParB/RepB/Spo0J family partition protein [Archangium sp.]|nr:ParB/RepB/Spo0J family partition protein [Archangium sp.]